MFFLLYTIVGRFWKYEVDVALGYCDLKLCLALRKYAEISGLLRTSTDYLK